MNEVEILKKIYKQNLKVTIEPFKEGNLYGVEFRVKDDLNAFRYVVPWQDFDKLSDAEPLIVTEILVNACSQLMEKKENDK